MTATVRRTMYAVIFGITILTLYLMIDSVTDRITVAEAKAENTTQALGQANSKVAALGDQVRGLGERPVVSTAPVTGPRLLPGPAGSRGASGASGSDGRQGADGVDGEDGSAGTPGATGPKGDTGATGPKGDTGSSGPAGADGKNGADGAPGANGQPGADGRGISGVSCTTLTPFTLTFTYTDGTSEDVACGE